MTSPKLRPFHFRYHRDSIGSMYPKKYPEDFGRCGSGFDFIQGVVLFFSTKTAFQAGGMFLVQQVPDLLGAPTTVDDTHSKNDPAFISQSGYPYVEGDVK